MPLHPSLELPWPHSLRRFVKSELYRVPGRLEELVPKIQLFKNTHLNLTSLCRDYVSALLRGRYAGDRSASSETELSETLEWCQTFIEMSEAWISSPTISESRRFGDNLHNLVDDIPQSMKELDSNPATDGPEISRFYDFHGSIEESVAEIQSCQSASQTPDPLPGESVDQGVTHIQFFESSVERSHFESLGRTPCPLAGKPVDEAVNRLTHLPFFEAGKTINELPPNINVTLFCSEYTLKYERLSALGGFADIYEGTSGGKCIAIKVLRVFSFQSYDIWRELLIWNRLHHPNILPLLGVTSLQPFGYNRSGFGMVSPWMPNGTLSHFLEKNPTANRHHLIVDLASGLNYMHSMNIIHGDPKSANILVDNSGRACLCDFGSSNVKDQGSAGGLAILPDRGGTIRYMAPELHLGFEDDEDGEPGVYKSLASDIFALASVILEVFTGLPPFCEFRIDVKVVLAIVSGAKPSRPCNTKQGFSDQLWDLMELCWTFDPRGRPLIKDVLELLTTISLSENVEPGTSTKVDVSPSVEATWVGVEKLYKTARATIGKTLFGTESFSSLRKLCRELGRHPQMCTISGGLRITSNEPIGAGTFSNVYCGRFGQHDVAIKIIREFRSNGDDRNIKEKRFSVEAIFWHFLKHENLVPFLGVSSIIPLFPKASEAPLCLVSEWMPHGTLCQYIVSHPSAPRLKLLSEIANGLGYLHSYSLVHSDLKGANIFVNKEHRACIADFGQTRFIYDQMLSENNELATAMEMSGSLRWMSREFLFPNDDSPRVPTLEGDIYAFGMVMWETFASKIPYPDETDGGVMLRVYQECIPERPPNGAELGLSDEVWDLMVRCWHGEDYHRPTASSALQELQTALDYGYSTSG